MKKGEGSRESIRSDGFLALEHLMYEPFFWLVLEPFPVVNVISETVQKLG